MKLIQKSLWEVGDKEFRSEGEAREYLRREELREEAEQFATEFLLPGDGEPNPRAVTRVVNVALAAWLWREEKEKRDKKNELAERRASKKLASKLEEGA